VELKNQMPSITENIRVFFVNAGLMRVGAEKSISAALPEASKEKNGGTLARQVSASWSLFRDQVSFCSLRGRILVAVCRLQSGVR